MAKRAAKKPVAKRLAKRVAKRATASRRTAGWSEAGGGEKVYTLEVFLIGGPVTEKFAKKNPVVSRTIQIRGDQTLKDLHYAIFEAFGRWEQHMYEFQFGKGPMEPGAPRYVMSAAYDVSAREGDELAGRVEETTIDSLKLRKGRAFGYWFDFGDDWWHQEGDGIGECPRLPASCPLRSLRLACATLVCLCRSVSSRPCF